MTRFRPLVPAPDRDPHAPPHPKPHAHAWRTESRHLTSEGWVLYVRCVCGVRRVDRQGYAEAPPTALTTAIPATTPR